MSALEQDSEFVERPAMLFEAGSYPDRDIEVTEDDLDRIVANTREAPIQVGHREPLFKLGFVRNLRRAGRQLLGTLCLHPEAHALIERNGLKTISAAVLRSKTRLSEVSITGSPRIVGAAMFSADGEEELVSFELGETPGGQAADGDDTEEFASDGYWITVHDHPVYIANKKVGHGRVQAVAEKHGFSEKARKALGAAHELGHISTDKHLFHAVRHAKTLQSHGLSEHMAVKTAIESARSRAAADSPAATGVREMSPHEIEADPERFQFKVHVGASGTNAELKGVEKWNPNLAGVVLAWKDPADGKTYVVNGHHRLELAKRLDAPNLAVRYVDAPNAEGARYIGALANIAEGRGTAIDAAKLMREKDVSPAELETDGVSLKGKLAQEGLALKSLPDNLWRQAYLGQMPVGRAVAIGGSGLSGSDQTLLAATATKADARGKRLSDGEVSELARHIQAAGHATAQTSSLFGDEEVKQNLFVEKAQLSSWLKQKLGQDKRLFGFVAKSDRAEKLAGAGNQINVSESQKVADQSAQMEDLFNRLAHRSGPVADALHGAATEMAQGKSQEAVRTQLYDRVRDAIQETLHGAPERHTEEEAPERDTQTASMFSDDSKAAQHGAREGTGMKGLYARLIAILHKKKAISDDEAAEFTEAIDAEKEPETADFSADRAELQKDRERLQKELDKIRGERITAQADAWAEREIQAGRATPAERDAMVAAFSTAAADDNSDDAPITFSEDGKEQKTTRVELLQRQYAARSPHRYFEELLKDSKEGKADAVALFNKMETDRHGAEKPMDDKRRDDLLSKSDVGRAILAERKGGK